MRARDDARQIGAARGGRPRRPPRTSRAGRAWSGRAVMRSPRYLAPRTSPTSARRVPASPTQCSGGLFVSTHFTSASPARGSASSRSISKICFVWNHCRLLGSSGRPLSSARTRPSPPMPSRSASRNFWRLSLSAFCERLEERAARRLVGDLAEAVGGLAADLGVLVLHELDERARPLRARRCARAPSRRAGARWRSGRRRAWRARRGETRLGEQLGVEAPSRRRGARPSRGSRSRYCSIAVLNAPGSFSATSAQTICGLSLSSAVLSASRSAGLPASALGVP